MTPPTHRTPLRRVSRGSLAAISRSGNFPDAPSGLGFMGPALENLADETEALQVNLEGLNALATSLETFNESFASYLYVQKVNTFSVEWFQAPVEASFELAEKRAKETAEAASLALRHAASSTPVSQTSTAMPGKNTVGDTTFAVSETQSPPKPSRQPSKKKTKAKMTAKEKKERGILLERICSVLPLEFRGSDPTLRRQVEHVIESLMDAEGALRITDMVKAEINQAKVNKCLIALVNRKVVQKISSPNGVLYVWQGLPS